MEIKQTVIFLDRQTPPHISTLILLAGVSALNMSVFLPSLHAMADYFDTDYSVMLLAVSLYMAATAIMQLIIGPLADRYGRRPVLLWSLVVYVLATVGTLLATDALTFLTCRMLQAVIASALVLSRAVVRDMYPADQAASMIGYVTMGMSIVPMIGPMIGGVLGQAFGWHAVFIMLLLTGIGLFYLSWRDLGETVAGHGMSFREQIKTYPELLSSRRFWGYVACTGFSAGAFYALLGGASFVSASVFGLSEIWTGVALGAPAVGYAYGNYLSGRHSARVGINRMALYGTVASTAGLALSLVLTLAGLSHPLVFFGCCTFLGFGNGLTMPNAIAGSLSVRPHLAGTASGLGGAIMIGFGAVLSAFAGSLLDEGSTELPLQLIMVVTSALATVSILAVIRREAQLS